MESERSCSLYSLDCNQDWTAAWLTPKTVVSMDTSFVTAVAQREVGFSLHELIWYIPAPSPPIYSRALKVPFLLPESMPRITTVAVENCDEQRTRTVVGSGRGPNLWYR